MSILATSRSIDMLFVRSLESAAEWSVIRSIGSTSERWTAGAGWTTQPGRPQTDAYSTSSSPPTTTHPNATYNNRRHAQRHDWGYARRRDWGLDATSASVGRRLLHTSNPPCRPDTHKTDKSHSTNIRPPSQILNLPNLLSFSRLLSGPAIGYLILQNNLSIAVPCLVLSAFTDWLDGYTARRTNAVNVLGSYLDPLADKVLVGSVVCCMGWTGMLEGWLFALIIGRDVGLVAGSFALRAKRFGYRWPGGGYKEFFNLQSSDDDPPQTPSTNHSSLSSKESPRTPSNGSSSPLKTRPAAPLFVSKVNTVAQLALVSSALTHAWVGWPPHELVTHILGPLTAGTTVLSGLAYVQAYRQGRVEI
jgi:phosphatidylglycerophosphate synthase